MSKISKFLYEAGYYDKVPNLISDLTKFADDHYEFSGANVPEALLGRKFKSQEEALRAAQTIDFKYH